MKGKSQLWYFSFVYSKKRHFLVSLILKKVKITQTRKTFVLDLGLADFTELQNLTFV